MTLLLKFRPHQIWQQEKAPVGTTLLLPPYLSSVRCLVNLTQGGMMLHYTDNPSKAESALVAGALSLVGVRCGIHWCQMWHTLVSDVAHIGAAMQVG